MTGPEHFKQAEVMVAAALDYTDQPETHHVQLGQLAQVHALLALAAATADVAVMRPEERDEWDRATGRIEATP